MSAVSFEVPDGLFEPFMEESQRQPWYFKKAVPLQTWFETSGVKPVQGAAAEHTNGVLSIINTPDNIERIASLTEECLRKSSKTLAFTLQTIQAPAGFLRDLAHQTTRSADDTAMLAAAEAAVARGEARLITSLFLETKSGNRATHEAVNEHAFISKFHTDAKSRPLLDFATRPVGSVFQIDPTIGINGRTVEITLEHEFHSAPPETRREHFRDPASNKPFEMPIDDFIPPGQSPASACRQEAPSSSPSIIPPALTTPRCYGPPS